MGSSFSTSKHDQTCRQCRQIIGEKGNTKNPFQSKLLDHLWNLLLIYWSTEELLCFIPDIPMISTWYPHDIPAIQVSRCRRWSRAPQSPAAAPHFRSENRRRWEPCRSPCPRSRGWRLTAMEIRFTPVSRGWFYEKSRWNQGILSNIGHNIGLSMGFWYIYM